MLKRGSMTPHGSGCRGWFFGMVLGPCALFPPGSRRLAHRIILRIIPPELLLPVISKLDPPANCISKLASFGLRHQLVRRVIPRSARRGSLILVLSLHLSFSLSLWCISGALDCLVRRHFSPVSSLGESRTPIPFDLTESPCHWTDSTSPTSLPPAL